MSFPWANEYKPTNPLMQWVDSRLPLPRFVYNAVGAGYPVPRNLNYMWNFGVLAGFALVTTVIDIPFSLYRTFVIEEKFGFNQTTPKLYIIDQLKGILLAGIIGLPLMAAVLWIFQHVPNAWLWAWACVSAFQLLMMWLAPAVILPLFNKFEPMPEGELRTAIEAMAKRLIKAGHPVSVWNRTAAKAVPLLDLGAIAHASAAQAQGQRPLAGLVAVDADGIGLALVGAHRRQRDRQRQHQRRPAASWRPADQRQWP